MDDFGLSLTLTIYKEQGDLCYYSGEREAALVQEFHAE